MRLFTLLSLAFILAIPCQSQSVISIDTSFNSTGYSTIDLSPSVYLVQGGSTIAVNPGDNKYLVRAFVNPWGTFLKYDRKGRLDTSFNHSGLLFQPLSEKYQPDFYIDTEGNLISASVSTDGTSRLFFFRNKADGKTDSSFDNDGQVLVAGSNNAGGRFVRTPDGGILVANMRPDGMNFMKIKSNFTMDSSFGTNGRRDYVFNNKDFNIRSTKIDQNGRILLATYTNNPVGQEDFNLQARLLRFLPNGDLDNSFGKNGIVTANFDSTRSKGFFDCISLPDGKIVATGFRRNSSNDQRGFAARYFENGTPDSSFGVFGRTDLPECFVIYHVKAQRDGRLLLTGEGPVYPIIRLTEDGNRDWQVGNKGVYLSPITGAQGGFPFGMLLENDSSVLLTGYAGNTNQSNNVTTARYAISFQPLIKGLKSKYCVGETGSGKIINLPKPGSDTIVTIKVDNTLVTANPSGEFSFAVGTVGEHSVEVRYTKGTRAWREFFKFTTSDHITPTILTANQAVCSSSISFLTIKSNVPVYWENGGIELSETGPVASINVEPRKFTGIQKIVAIKDNGGCGAQRDTIILSPVELNPVLTVADTVLSSPLVPGATYKWLLNNLIIPGATANSYKALQNGSYKVIETLGSCSKTSAPATISSYPDPLPVPVFSTLPSKLCEDAGYQTGKLLNPPPAPAVISITLNAVTALPFSLADSSFTFLPGSTGTNNIKATYAYSSDSKDKTVYFDVVATPSSGPVPVQNGNNLTANIPATSYQWYLNGTAITGANAAVYQITQPGSYTYTYMNDSCKSAISPAIVSTITAIVDPATGGNIRLTPNPAQNRLYLAGLRSFTNYHVTLFNIWGSVVTQQVVAGGQQAVVKLDGISSGFYIVKIQELNGKKLSGSQKIVVIQ